MQNLLIASIAVATLRCYGKRKKYISQYLFVLYHVRSTSVPGYLSRYSDSIRAGRSGDRISVGGEIFRTRLDQPWGPPSLLYNGYQVFPGGKAVGSWR
jgi:hypothetical protein